MSLKYEPSSEPLHLNPKPYMQEHMDRFKGSRAISSSDYFDNSPGGGAGQVSSLFEK